MPRRSLAKLLAVPVILLLAIALPVQLHAQALSFSRILVCESRDDTCNRPDAQHDIVWTFNGTEGTAGSPGNSAGSRLRIEKLDGNSIVVGRTDISGPTAGLTALYAGTLHGVQISGSVRWSWLGRADYPANGVFSALLQDQPAAERQNPGVPDSPRNSLPSELLVCEDNKPCNGAWTIHGSEGEGTWFAKNPVKARLTVIRSGPDDILIRRADTTDAVSATYAGSLHGDHYSGTIIWSTPGHPGGSTGRWTATVPETDCAAAHANADIAEARRLGQIALMFHRERDSLDCYTVAAASGDATAQMAVGLLYYQGRATIPQDYTQALIWLRKAADQGNYAAQRTVAEMYTVGQGTNRDPAYAAIYTRRADEQKHDMERRQDLNERAADR